MLFLCDNQNSQKYYIGQRSLCLSMFFPLVIGLWLERAIDSCFILPCENMHGTLRWSLDAGSTTRFWRDPDTEFCNICGDDKGNHLELMCPYNYLSPAAYFPCRARLALWGNYTTTLRYKCSRHREEEQSEPPMHDEANARRLGFLRCLVRVNNLSELCPPEQLVELFGRFGPLWMWYVPTRGSGGTCKGFGCVVFQRHRHAEEAVEALNCWEFGGRKLRVDWAYPCLNWWLCSLVYVPTDSVKIEKTKMMFPSKRSKK